MGNPVAYDYKRLNCDKLHAEAQSIVNAQTQ